MVEKAPPASAGGARFILEAGSQSLLFVPDVIGGQSRPILHQGLLAAALPIAGVGSFHHNIVAPVVRSTIAPLGGVFQQAILVHLALQHVVDELHGRCRTGDVGGGPEGAIALYDDSCGIRRRSQRRPRLPYITILLNAFFSIICVKS